MKFIAKVLVTVCILLSVAFPVSAADEGVVIVNFHDVGVVYNEGKKANDYTISPSDLRSYFSYLRSNGYHPINVNQYVAYNRGQGSLPAKPVVITFDDGYASFYEQVFPILKEYNYPAVVALVTTWMEGAPAPESSKLITWKQAAEMEKSGLVEIASHSHSLHHFIPFNPYGEFQQAGSSFQYIDGRYESLESFQMRIRNDLRKNQAVFERELGHKARTLVWPYGEYNAYGVEIGKAEGFEVFFGLDGGFNPQSEASLLGAKRGIVIGNPTLTEFAKFVQAGGKDFTKMRIAQIDLDELYDPSSSRITEANIAEAIERLSKSGINTVYLQAFADDNGDGNIESVYFQTTVAPMKSDIFGHVSKRFADQGFDVYAWMPTLSCQWLTKGNPQDLVVAYDSKGKGWYKRATPFSPAVREKLKALYRDMAAYSWINGLLFQDDLYLNDYEDFSPSAKQAFKARFGKELTADILKDDQIRAAWTQVKTEALNQLTLELMETVKLYRPHTVFARNIYAEAVLDPKSVEWYAQKYSDYFALYDYVVIMAYPYMEKKGDQAVPWLNTLADAALSNPAYKNKVVFKLQSYDWDKKKWVPVSDLRKQIKALQAKGAMHIGYYPEHLIVDKAAEAPFGF